MRDFEDEVPGYLRNEEIARTLGGLRLEPGPRGAPANLLRCYEALVAAGIMPLGEIDLVKSWISDLSMAGWAPEEVGQGT